MRLPVCASSTLTASVGFGMRRASRMSEDNKTWNNVMEGKATRAAAKPAEKKEDAGKK